MQSSVEAALSKIFPEDAPEELIEFARYWLSKRRGRPMPAKADIDPVDIPWALDRIFILKRGPENRFVYHLIGEKMTERLGGRVKGKTADQVFEPVYARYTEARWEKAANERLICFNGSYHLTVGNVPRLARRVMLPLSQDGETVDELVGIVHYDWPGEMPGRPLHDPGYRFIHWTPVSDLAR